MRRLAFTVVELLVVIAIIGVLTALILPAVQMARESSRLATCRNNLKQIAVAAAAHAEAFEHFPNAGGRDGQPRSVTASGTPKRSLEQDWGWAYQILPYIEKQDVYINTDSAAVAGLKFKGYFCPTRRPPTTVSGNPTPSSGLPSGTSRGALDYAGNGGEITSDSMGTFFFGLGSSVYTRSLGNQNGTIIPRPNIQPGIRSEKISPQAISDGLSNVVMFGERQFNRQAPRPQADEDHGYFNGWSVDTIRWGFEGPPTPDRFKDNGTPYSFRFGGAHSGVCNFAMSDGSVKPMQYSRVDLTIFRQLVNRNDKLSPQIE